MKKVALTLGCGLLLCGTLGAQEFPRFSFDLGAGFTRPIGNTQRNLDTGWNIAGGAGFNFTSYLGAMIQADYNSFGINSTTLSNLGFPGGDVKIFSARLDPIVHLTGHRPIDVYVTGGGGLYHMTQEFTQPSISTFTAFDPFFGFYQVSTPSTQILSSYTIASILAREWGWAVGAVASSSRRPAIIASTWAMTATRIMCR